MKESRSLPPTILVIFGISGDLSRRYLLPALAQICQSTQLTKDLKILGVSRRNINLDEVLTAEQKSLRRQSEIFKLNLAEESDYPKLKTKLTKLSKGFKNKPQIIFYFAVPPVAVLPIISNLGKAGLNNPRIKLLLEKPFGTDWLSAQELAGQKAAEDAADAANPFKASNPLEGVEANPFETAKKVLNPFN